MSRTHRLNDPHWPRLPARLEAHVARALGRPHDHLRCGWHCGYSSWETPERRPKRSVVAAELTRRGIRPRRARGIAERLGRWYEDRPDREMKILAKRAARHRVKQLITVERYDEIGPDPRSCCACGW